MKIKIKYNSWVPSFIGVEGIILYPFILISKSEKEAKKMYILRHEWIHVKQIRKEGIMRFYFKYFFIWFFNLLKYFNLNKAYESIPYEKEAYSNSINFKLPKKLE